MQRRHLPIAAILLGLLLGHALIPLSVRAVNNDGQIDILWSDPIAFNNQAWTMNWTTHINTLTLPSLWSNTNWVMCGYADFNNDGQLDLLWRNPALDLNYVWFMNGTTYLGSAQLLSTGDTNWMIVGTGYFSSASDKYIDILWRHKTLGLNAVWLMQGTNYLQAQALPAVYDMNWAVGGVGDFNQDGMPDIFWNNTYDGRNSVWYMNGTNFVSSDWATTISTNYSCAGVGDFNGDNQPDILWRYRPNGNTYIWVMNRLAWSSTAYVGYQGLNWIVGGLGDSKVDSDSDGMADLWERNNFGTLGYSGADDYDGDGWTNLQEYLWGKNPAVPELNVSVSKPKASSNVP